MYTELALLLLLSPALVVPTPIQDCGSNEADVEATTVENCDDSAEACPLKRGTDTTITVKFTPKKKIDALSTVVHGIIAGMPVPFPMPHPDACQDSGLTCPLSPGDSYTYKTTLPIKDVYPKVKVMVKWELKESDGSVAVCLMIPCRIV